jgi:hypothetical protein
VKLKLLLASVLALALSPLLLASDRAEGVRSRCAQAMQMGACVALGPVTDYSPERLASPWIAYGIGVATFRDYLEVRGLGSTDPTDLRMCDVAADACRADWNSPRCIVGRGLWGE